MPQPSLPALTLRRLLAAAAVVLVLVAGLLYLNRRTIARDALTGWLRSKGVPAEAQVEAFGPSGFTGALRIGDPKRPDFTAQRVKVGYRLTVRGFEVTSVELRR